MSGVTNFFADHGYFHARGVFDSETVKGLSSDFDKIVHQVNSSGENIDAAWDGDLMARISKERDLILHTHNVQKYSRVWLNAFLDHRFLDVASAILGEDVILHHSKLFQKPAHHGSPFPIHQDWTYFPTAHNSMIAAVIHLTDTNDEMGCLRVYPGSHKLGRIAGSNGRAECPPLSGYALENATALEAKSGDVVFFHYLTLHGSMANRSDRPRKTVLCQLHAGHDYVEDGNEHPNERLVLKGWNHAISRSAAGAKPHLQGITR